MGWTVDIASEDAEMHQMLTQVAHAASAGEPAAAVAAHLEDLIKTCAPNPNNKKAHAVVAALVRAVHNLDSPGDKVAVFSSTMEAFSEVVPSDDLLWKQLATNISSHSPTTLLQIVEGLEGTQLTDMAMSLLQCHIG